MRKSWKLTILKSAVLVFGFASMTLSNAEAGEAYKIIRTYTDQIAPAPLNKRVDVQCASSNVGGMMIEGAKIGFYYNGIDEEWCRASHACTKTFKEIAARSCMERNAAGN